MGASRGGEEQCRLRTCAQLLSSQALVVVAGSLVFVAGMVGCPPEGRFLLRNQPVARPPTVTLVQTPREVS